MGECCTNGCEEYVKFGRNMKLDGRRWEYPIPKSKDYWEKFCRDEEKKLLVVRDPSVQLSYNSFPKKRSLRFRVDGSMDCENSLHKLTPLKSKFKSNKLCNSNKESFPKPILKLSSQARAKSLDKRNPKLGALRSDRSFGKIVSDKNDYIENKQRAHSSFPSTLPQLNAFPKISPIHSKSIKSNRTQLVQRKGFPEIKSVCSTTNRNSEIDENSFKYPIRCAYKALKQVTANKKLNFDRETVFESLGGSSPIEDEGETKLFEPIDAGKPEKSNEEFPRWKETLKDSQSAGIDVQRATLKLEEMSTTIPSGSRSTSGSSPRFAHLEPWESPSSRVLSSIPKLSSFPRKHRDRCLPCIYKSFESQPERKISLPVTSLQKIINSRERRVVSSGDTSEDSNSVYADTVERILNGAFDGRKVTFDEPNNIPESEIVKETPSAQEYREEASRTTAETVPASESSCKAVTQKDKEYQRAEESVSTGKNLNDVAKLERVASSLERSKLSSSLRSGSSDEDDSLAVSIDDDQSRPKYLAPCHMPTIFKPSLEPLKALRNRKPTTLQDRIAFLESSSRKSSSVNDRDEAQEKRTKLSKPEVPKAEKSGPAVRIFTKAKSIPGDMILENEERVANKEHVLRKGVSVANFAVPGDTCAEQDSTGKTEDSTEKLDDHPKPSSDVSKTAPRLPLTDTIEILEVLQNLEANSPTSMLEALCKEFSERLSTSVPNDSAVEKHRKIIPRLTSLLVDSKRYLDPEKFPSDLVFSSNQPPPCNPQLLQRILPEKSYNLVAPLLGLPKLHSRGRSSVRYSSRIDWGPTSTATVASGDHSLASLEVRPPTSRDSESLNGEAKVGHLRYNPYALFLRKPRRKVITWRPLETDDLEGYDPNATLKMRTDNIMSMICEDFCRWLDTLGGTDKTVDEEVLKDMFEIDFTAEACRSMQVLTQEMPVVPAEVALTRNTPSAGKLAMTKKHVLRDARAEETPARTIAFGAKMPWELQFTPPKNQVRSNWLQCDHVPAELETMDVVWKDITNLKSVRGFVEWLQQHPEVPPPDPLKALVSTDIEALRQVEDDEEFAHLELDIYQITSFRVGNTGNN